MEYAGFWIRFGALLIDMVFMSIVFLFPLTLIYGEEYWLGDQIVHGFWDMLLGYVVPIVVTIWFWLRYMGTPGKMALKLRIVDASSGEKMSMEQAIGRYFAYILATLPLLLGLLWVGVDRKKQGWHDKLAGTVVIRHRGKEPVSFGQEAQ
ncbi:RDD family protein [Porticoccus sp.]